MKSGIIAIAGAALFGFAGTASAVDYFDGKKPLLCSIFELFQCDPQNECQSVTPEQIDAFSHLSIDFAKKTITRPGQESGQKSDIQRVETDVDGKLVIQGIETGDDGVENGAGWSVSIMNPEGTMVLTASSAGFAIVGLGACVPQP